MKNNIYDLSDVEIDDFDKMYDGTISDEEYFIFKAKLELDEILRHKFLVYQSLRNEIEQDGLSNKVLKARFNYLVQSRRQRKRKIFTLSFFTIVIVLITYLKIINAHDINIELYNKYKNYGVAVPLTMAKSNPSELNKALIAIANEQFDVGLQKLANCNSTDTVTFFTAYCKEQLEEDETAIKLYQKLTHSASTLIKEKSQFRRALLQLKLRRKNAENELKIIAKDSNHMYSKAAQEILSSLTKN